MKEKNKIIIILISFVVFIFLLSGKGSLSSEQTQTIEGSFDLSGSDFDFDKFLIEEDDFDYSEPIIQQIAQDIKSSSSTPYEAMKLTATYVVDNIQYSSKVTVQSCYEETASSALILGKGDCVSMARAVTAILRAQGIPTRTVGGCLSLANRCSPLFAVSPILDAQVTTLVEGDFKKRGFLHEWVESYDPQRGWLIIEATSGQIFPIDCQSYIIFGYDSNNFNRCVITDSNFWNLCSIS